ncbi:chromate transporter [Hutsoniella sourekii]
MTAPETNRSLLLRKLFISTLTLSAFTFGGGYVIVTMMKKTFVDDFAWIDEEEMLDLVAIAQSAPGAMAVNGAIVVGYKLAGISGVLTAVVATIIPPFLIISLISIFYEAFISYKPIAWLLEGMQVGVAAVILSVVFDMGRGVLASRNRLSILSMIFAFLAHYFWGLNVIYLILIGIGLGLLQFWLTSKEGSR